MFIENMKSQGYDISIVSVKKVKKKDDLQKLKDHFVIVRDDIVKCLAE